VQNDQVIGYAADDYAYHFEHIYTSIRHRLAILIFFVGINMFDGECSYQWI